jgi:hypothetical protein
VLHALLVLDSMRLVREKQQARGVPSGIAQAVNQRHAVARLNHAIATRGQVGIPDWMPGWFRTVGSGELYRLGQLEFILQAWDYPFRAYANSQTHEVIVLAEAGQRFTQDSYLAVGEGALSLDALRDALTQAESFFDQYYPERPFMAYMCDSWLFSQQLEAMLPPESNILRWQREGYLLPGDDDSGSFLLFTFGSKTFDLATAPQDTRLQRAIIAYLASGGQLRCGGYLLLRTDLSRFGGSRTARVSSKPSHASSLSRECQAHKNNMRIISSSGQRSMKSPSKSTWSRMGHHNSISVRRLLGSRATSGTFSASGAVRKNYDYAERTQNAKAVPKTRAADGSPAGPTNTS